MNKYEIVGVVGEGAYVQLNTVLAPSYSLLLVNSGFKHATCYYNKLDGVALASKFVELCHCRKKTLLFNAIKGWQGAVGSTSDS